MDDCLVDAGQHEKKLCENPQQTMLPHSMDTPNLPRTKKTKEIATDKALKLNNSGDNLINNSHHSTVTASTSAIQLTKRNILGGGDGTNGTKHLSGRDITNDEEKENHNLEVQFFIMLVYL